MRLLPRRLATRFETYLTGGASATWTECDGSGYHDYDALPWCAACGGELAYVQEQARQAWEYLQFVTEDPFHYSTEDLTDAATFLRESEEDVITVLGGGTTVTEHGGGWCRRG